MEECNHSKNTILHKQSSKTKHADLNNFVESFDKLINETITLMKEKTNVTEELKSMKDNNTKLENKVEESEKVNNDMQNMIDELHKQLQQICDLEEQNKQLKLTLHSREDEIKEANSKFVNTVNRHRIEIETIKSEHKEEIDRINQDLKTDFKRETTALKETIDQKDSRIKKLENELLEADKDKKAEIINISMDYENKISKLKQKIPTTSNPASSANQEIFRKKLQHMKTEYDREILLLKQTVTDLQEKLSSQNTTNRLSLTSGKKRKY